jgi:protein gp37
MTSIEWTQRPGTKGETWNPVVAFRTVNGKRLRGWHCEHASPGCVNCYAETQNTAGYRGGTLLPYKPGHRKDVEIELHEPTLQKPLHWRDPRTIFPCSMTDLFGDWVTDEMLDRIFTVMAWTPQHIYIVVTKRSARMRAYFEARKAGDPWAEAADYVADLHGLDDHPFVLEPKHVPLPNVWFLVSVEDQPRADERIPDLLMTPAAVRGVSAEPLIAPIDFTKIRGNINVLGRGSCPSQQDEHGYHTFLAADGLDWVVLGGESGSNARLHDLDWDRPIIAQCLAAGVAVFQKQLGSRPFSAADRISHRGCTLKGPPGFYRYLNDRKGGDPAEWPEDLCVRQFPEVRT